MSVNVVKTWHLAWALWSKWGKIDQNGKKWIWPIGKMKIWPNILRLGHILFSLFSGKKFFSKKLMENFHKFYVGWKRNGAGHNSTDGLWKCWLQQSSNIDSKQWLKIEFSSFFEIPKLTEYCRQMRK